MTRLIDLTGQRFGKLVVIKREGTRPAKTGPGSMPTWSVVCDCGTRKVVLGANLREGITRSCGCMGRPHGMYGTPENSAWASMIQRCRNPRNGNYPYYGARGITVCDRWSRSFLAFWEDMGPRPTKRHSLDRIDNNGNYEPSNCRWATRTVQSRNRRTAHVLTVGGRSATISEWAEMTGIGKTTIRERIQRGWSPERAVVARVDS